MAPAHAVSGIRHSRNAPCPVCGGYATLPHHRGIRCAGFSLDYVAYCTREEHAGPLPLDLSTEPASYKHLLFGRCGCGNSHGLRVLRRDEVGQTGRLDPAMPLELRHEIYAAALGLATLRIEAERDLLRRGLRPEDLERVGYKSIPVKGGDLHRFLSQLVDRFGEETLRHCPGFQDKNGNTSFWAAFAGRDGYIVPYRSEAGLITGVQLRLLGGRYETARTTRTAEMYHVAGPVAPSCDLYVTEGGIKAEVANRLGGITVLGLAGQSLAAEHVERIQSWRPGRVIVALDQEGNVNTERAREGWQHKLAMAGLVTYNAVWEGEDVGGPKGLDDLYFKGGRPRLRAVSFVPPETGLKRRVRQVGQKGPVELGLSQETARKVTSDAIAEFIAQAGRRQR